MASVFLRPLICFDEAVTHLLGHYDTHAPPKITPVPPSPLPGIRIHQRDIIRHTRFLILRNIPANTRSRERHAACLVEIDLVWSVDGEWGPAGSGVARSVIGRGAIRYGIAD